MRATSSVTRRPRVEASRLIARDTTGRLTCRKPKADDWVWMIDHTLQLGPYKCLIIIGIRLSIWDETRPLEHEDMTLLDLTPMEQSSGEQVREQLEAVTQITGLPRAVVSDEGTDLKRGMELFRRDPVSSRCYQNYVCGLI